MEIVVWIATGALAGLFLIAGLAKMLAPKEKLKDQGLEYVEDFSDTTIRIIGGLEILAAIGLILPGVTGIATVLVPVAATCLVFTMIAAIYVHVRRGETSEIPKNIAILALAAFVAFARFGPYPL